MTDPFQCHSSFIARLQLMALLACLTLAYSIISNIISNLKKKKFLDGVKTVIDVWVHKSRVRFVKKCLGKHRTSQLRSGKDHPLPPLSSISDTAQSSSHFQPDVTSLIKECSQVFMAMIDKLETDLKQPVVDKRMRKIFKDGYIHELQGSQLEIWKFRSARQAESMFHNHAAANVDTLCQLVPSTAREIPDICNYCAHLIGLLESYGKCLFALTSLAVTNKYEEKEKEYYFYSVLFVALFAFIVFFVL